MINLYDIAYGLGLGIAAPFWLIKPTARRKVLGALSERMGRFGATPATRDINRPAVMIHAVSLGEINSTRSLITLLQQSRPQLQYIVSTTTTTGHARAQELYGSQPDVTVIRYPLDFTGAVSRVLDTLRPTIVVLLELEMWPNFLRQCGKRQIPVVLINGRMTTYSHRTYGWIAPITRRMLRRLAKVCVQDDIYAKRFIDRGAPPENVQVTGTMKFDTAQILSRVPGDEDVATAVGLWPGAEPIWVCGSTGPGEEEMLLRTYRSLLERFSRLRLVIVPRHPDRFGEVARQIEAMKFQLVRRSKPMPIFKKSSVPAVILGDTMGELRKFYSLASIVFVGRSMVDLGPRQHGSDMIEPAALARPILVGPHTDNFAEAMNAFRKNEAILEVRDEASLLESMTVLLSTPNEAAAMARRAQETVRSQQGATNAHVKVILEALDAKTNS